MTTVVLGPTNTAGYHVGGGGHWWVFLQYALSLRDLGCRVVWLERCAHDTVVGPAVELLEHFGFPASDVLFYAPDPPMRWVHGSPERFAAITREADLFLDIDYCTPPEIVSAFRRSALIDIDPGLLQFWWAQSQLVPAPHDRWVTTGETVGTDRALFSSCGVEWFHIRPPLHLASWPVSTEQGSAYTTITSWWGGEWLTEGEVTLDNNKRAAYLAYLELPTRTAARIELSGGFGGVASGVDPAEVLAAETGGDEDDVRALLAHGWRLRRSEVAARDVFTYRDYVAGSRGEFSCVKPSCVWFQNAWISDRTLCYLASGRPAVVEHTGPSELFDGDAGLLRFSSIDEAVAALADAEVNYQRHRDAARALVEQHFDGRIVLGGLLDELLR